MNPCSCVGHACELYFVVLKIQVYDAPVQNQQPFSFNKLYLNKTIYAQLNI